MNFLQEGFDFTAQRIGFAAQCGDGALHLGCRRAGVIGGGGDLGNIARHLLGPGRRLLNIAGDFLG